MIAFTLTYSLAASLFAILRGNSEFVIYILVMLVIVVAIWRVSINVNLSRGVLWALSIWGLAHMLGGLMPIPEHWLHSGNGAVLYNLWLLPDLLKYDQLVHAYGFGTTTFVFWESISAIMARSSKVRPQPTFGLLLIAVAAALGMGALNEIVEFVTTLFVENTNVGDYNNTGWDLVFNMIGASLAAIWIRLRAETVRDPKIALP